MKKEFNRIVKDFIHKSIEEKSEYMWLTDLVNNETIFKTNQDYEGTIKKVIAAIDKLDNNKSKIKDVILCNDCISIIVASDKGGKTFYSLYDNAFVVIESV